MQIRHRTLYVSLKPNINRIYGYFPTTRRYHRPRSNGRFPLGVPPLRDLEERPPNTGSVKRTDLLYGWIDLSQLTQYLDRKLGGDHYRDLLAVVSGRPVPNVLPN